MSVLLHGGVLGQGAAFSPLSLSPQFWLDARTGVLDGSSAVISADGTAVGTWQDQSGNGNHFTQATGARQPAWHNTSGNFVQGDGADDGLANAAVTLAQPSTLYLLARVDSWVNTACVIGCTSDRLDLQLLTSGGNKLSVYNNGAYQDFGDPGAGFHVWTITINGTTVTGQIDSNAATSGTAGSGSTAAVTFGLFSFIGTGGQAAAVSIKQLLYYPALHSAPEQASVISYLQGVA